MSKASLMVNYRVDNLDALPEDLKSGIEIDPHREYYDCGRFGMELGDPSKPKEQ